jgi:CheY-like chemotaxis protein
MMSTPNEGADKKTILVIDDEELVRAVIRESLKVMGYDVLESADGVSGVHRFSRSRSEIAMVIVDRTMPRMVGEDVIKEIRAIRADVPILLISGYMEKDLHRWVEEDPKVLFLKKPFRRSQLAEKVDALMLADATNSS